MIRVASAARMARRASALHQPLRAASRPMAVKVLTDESEFEAASNSQELAVVYFTASWCGPCKMISPVFESVSDENPTLTFLKVDVDDQPDVAAAAQVAAMPTFQFFKNGKRVETVQCTHRPNSLHSLLAEDHTLPLRMASLRCLCRSILMLQIVGADPHKLVDTVTSLA